MNPQPAVLEAQAVQEQLRLRHQFSPQGPRQGVLPGLHPAEFVAQADFEEFLTRDRAGWFGPGLQHGFGGAVD